LKDPKDDTWYNNKYENSARPERNNWMHRNIRGAKGAMIIIGAMAVAGGIPLVILFFNK